MGRFHRIAAVLLLAGCTAPQRFAASYVVAEPPPPVVLVFTPQADEPAPADRAHLAEAAVALPPATLPELYVTGPHALARARAVRRLLQRPVLVLPPLGGEAGPDVAVVVFPGSGGMISTACLGPGTPPVEGFWPGSGRQQPPTLPEGCATAASIQAQVSASGNAADLLTGRLLPPGAAFPFTDAIERYYRRNEPGQHGAGPSAASGASSSSPAAAGGSPSSGNTSSGSFGAGAAAGGANPLLGPLPGAADQPVAPE